jgi:hypothetical protein
MMRLNALLAGVALGAALTVPGHAAPESAAVRTGGVGLEERAALDSVRDGYNLRVAFAEVDGEFVADVEVRLSAAGGEPVYYSGTTDGPFLFARLDPGKYRLEARYAGLTQVRTLTVGAAQAQPYIYVRWPAVQAGEHG